VPGAVEKFVEMQMHPICIRLMRCMDFLKLFKPNDPMFF
jgi:hypothetical protein